MDQYVDNPIEDEAERKCLLTKPTCFIVIGRPGVGKSTLAKKIAESWRCILVDDTDLLNTHMKNKTKEGKELLDILSEKKSIPEDMVLQLILTKLNSPYVEHYGYVLSCLPFMSEDCQKIHEQIEMIKNLKLSPDFIINIKCADKDLVLRLSRQNQDSETEQLDQKDQLKPKEDEKVGEKVKQEEDQAVDQGLQKEIIDQLVWTPTPLAKDASLQINMYRDAMLRPLEDYIMDHNPLYLMELDGNSTPEELHSAVMSRLGSMAIQRVSVPVLLQQSTDPELPDSIDTEELLRIVSSRTTVPGFRWRRSRWGRTCPVALKEGRIVPGKPALSVGFQGKLYILSSQEAAQKFVTNPRPYLLPPMPSLPCRVSIIGPPKTGKSTLCKLLAQHYSAAVLDLEEMMEEKLDSIKEERTRVAIEKVKAKLSRGDDTTSAEVVTKHHPEVRAMVHSALEEAKHMSTSPNAIYADVLQEHVKEVEEAEGFRIGWVLDSFPKNVSQMAALQQAGVQPEILFCLKDDGNQVLSRLYDMNKKNMAKGAQKMLHTDQTQILHDKQQESEGTPAGLHLGTVVEPEASSPDRWGAGSLDDEKMNDYKLQLQEFMTAWRKMQSALIICHLVLEIGGRSPEDLLQEMVHEMERTFKYTSWELSPVDLEEDANDIEALAELDRPKEGDNNNDATQSEDKMEKLLGDTHHFCPVTFKNYDVLLPCTDEVAARYRERTYYFSNSEARKTFLQDPEKFVAQNEPLKPPALRILLLGTRGSGKTTQGEWLAEQLELFYIQFREHLQMLIMAKTKKRVPYADESSKEPDEDFQEQEVKTENVEEVVLTEEEEGIKAYLYDGSPLTPQILDMVVAPFWKNEPYKSTGFILEGFPHNPDEVQYLLQQKLFPDVVVVMEVKVNDVQNRLLPAYLEKWQKRRDQREVQLAMCHKPTREEKIAKRRAELMKERESIKQLSNQEEEEEEDDAINPEDDIEAILQEEFPMEEENDEKQNEETEEAAMMRLAMEVEERFVADKKNLITVKKLLNERHIPEVSINGSPRPRIVQHHLLQKVQPLLTNRESLFQKCQPIPYPLACKLLVSSIKFYSAFGCWDPIMQYNEGDLIQPLQWPINSTHPLIFHRYIYFFASKENQNAFMLSPLKYLRQPKPSPTLPVKIAIVGPPKSGKTTVAQTFARKYGLARLSIGSVMRKVLNTQEHSDLSLQMKKHLHQGLVVPDELAIQCLEVVLMSSTCSIQGYVLDGFPMTIKQAELMESRSIIPMIVAELEVDTVEVLKRGLVVKTWPNKPHLTHDSSDILHIRNSCYKQEIESVRQHFQQQYNNWVQLDGSKSKWFMWDSIIREASVSMKYIHTYLERRCSGLAACINRLCITPNELQSHLGEFDHFCPVCLALNYHLVDCSDDVSLENAAEYRSHYYKMCDKDHLERFLTSPERFVTPGCPHSLPEPHLLPKKLNEIQDPQQIEMNSFCPVTYLEGEHRHDALVQGNMDYGVEYREKIYIFQSMQKQDKFMRSPEIYWDQKLPSKLPSHYEQLSLTTLPTAGYLEQGVAATVIKAMTAAGCLKPKYPFLCARRSALLYVAYYLKAFDEGSTDYTRDKYRKRLALFEENCALIPYLSSTMRDNYKPPSERPDDFDDKLKRFLALAGMSRTKKTL